MRVTRRGLMAGALVVSMGVSGPVQAQGASYILATASVAGTFFPVGVAISTLTRVRLEPTTGIGMSAIASAGSGENVRLMRENEAQFSILQALFGYYAVNGIGPVEADGPQENIRSIMTLWPNVEHFIVSASRAETGTVADFLALRGERVNLGAQSSGTLGSNRLILGNAGIDIDEHFQLVFSGFGPAAEQMQNAQVAGVSINGGPPVGAITQLMAAAGDSVRILDVTDEEIALLDGGFNLWTRFVIPAGTYPGQTEPINTIGQPNFLAVNADVPEDHVYEITRAVFENLPFLNAIHPATEFIQLKSAIDGLPAPLHPGALRFFREAGLDIPDRLIAD